MLKAVIIGFGGIAQLHRYAYWSLNREGVPVRLVAACDADPEKFKTVTKMNLALPGDITDELPFNTYTDWREMVEKEKPELVDICLPTRFHEGIASGLLEMGIPVLCEKPMSESYSDCKKMLDAARNSDRMLMTAHCVRFQPEYEYLQAAVSGGIYGAVRSVELYRLTGFPDWGDKAWRGAAQRTGSCLFDLNIHDIDVMLGIFGRPESVSAKLESNKYPFDSAESRFYYRDFEAKVTGKWLEVGEGFSCGYKVTFEKGVLTYENKTVTFTGDGKTEKINIPDRDMITEEIRYFANCLINSTENTKNPPEDSAFTVYAIEKLFESSDKNGERLNLKLD